MEKKVEEQECANFSAIIMVLVAIVIMITATGCASSTGWRFEIGVSPVKSLDNRAGLVQEKPKVVKDW